MKLRLRSRIASDDRAYCGGAQATGRTLAAAVSLALVTLLAACGGSSEADLMASAKELIAKKDNKAAIIQIKNALQKNPQSGAARLLLGKTLLDTNDVAAALVELRKAQELQVPDEQVIPSLARAMILAREESKLVAQYGQLQLREPEAQADLRTSIATAYILQNEMDSARTALDEALRAKPGFAGAVLVQARLAAGEGQMDEALKLLDNVLASDKGNERAGVFKGEILWQIKRDPDAALATFRAVIAQQPRSITALAAVGTILMQQNKLPEAKAALADLQKVSNNHPETQFLQAQLAFRDKDWKAVREVTAQILKVLPESSRVLELAGAAEFRDKQYVQAEALLGKALKNAPRNGVTRNLLAQTYLRTGQPAKAVEVLAPMIGGEKPDATALALAGEAYLQLGDGAKSDAAFQRALKSAPSDARVRTSAAMAQLSKGNSPAAVTELENIAAGDTSPRADMALLAAKLRQKDFAGALKATESIEKKLPDRALAQVLRGRVLQLKGDTAAAAKAFEAALAKEPANFAAVAGLAGLDMAAKAPDAARKRFEDFLQASPRSQQAKLALAELELRGGAPNEKVLATLREAVKINPGEPTAHLVLVNRLLRSDDSKAALDAAQQAAAALPLNLEIQDALGRAQLLAGEPQRALTTFKQLANQQPKVAMHELRLADAHLALKDNEAASRSLRRALELEPDMPAARRGLVLIALADRRPQDALTQARELQKSHPKEPLGWTLEAQVEASRRNWDPAIAAYRAAQQKAKSPDIAARLHNALGQAGKQAEADRLAADWLREFPKDPVFRFYLGDTALGKGEWARAEEHYRDVLAIQPINPLALNNVAWLLVKQGKPGALPLAQKANQLLPDRAQLIDTLALALEADNQLPQALDAQRRAVSLDRKDGNLTLRLAKLYIKQGDKQRARGELETLAKQGEKFPAHAEVTSLLKTL